MKTHYLSDAEIDDITFKIYNDIPPSMDEDLSEDALFNFDEEVVKKLTKGEPYIRLEENPKYIITQSGRLLNVQRIKSIKPTALANDLFYLISGEIRVHFSQHFKKAGWEWDYKKILQNYVDNKWPMFLHNPARKLLEE